MKVLIVCNYPSVYGGNFIPSIISFAKRVIEDGGECIFMFPIQAENRKWIKELVCFGNIEFFGEDENQVIARLEKYEFDTVYYHFSPKIIYKIYKKYPHCQFIRHSHTDMGAKGLIHKTKFVIKKFLFLNKTKNIYVSEKLLKEENIKNSLYLPNGLDFSRFPLEKKESIRSSFRTKNGIPDDAFVFLHFGWHPYIKGTDIAIKAFTQFFNNHDNVYLMIVVGENSDISKFQALYANVDGIDSHILLVNPRQDVETYHFASDLYLLTSRSEGFSYSVLEALYAGEMVIATNLSGTKWSNDYGALLFEKENDIDCFNQMENAYQMKNAIDVRDKLKNNFSLDNWTRQIVKYINE